MLRFMYGLDYACETLGTWTMTAHAQVYVAAEEYEVTALKGAVALKLEQFIEWYHTMPAKNVADTIDALRILYSREPTDDRQVHTAGARYCASNLVKLSKHAALVDIMPTTELGADAALCLAPSQRGMFYRSKCGRRLDAQGKVRCVTCNTNNSKVARNKEHWFKLQ